MRALVSQLRVNYIRVFIVRQNFLDFINNSFQFVGDKYVLNARY